MSYTNGLDKPSDYFNTKLYAGTGATQSITGVNFQPDLVWIKNRQDTYNNHLFDVIRGVEKEISSDRTDAESTVSGTLTSFDSDGFTLGSAGNTNFNGTNHVSWNWLANGAGSSNTDGSITSTVSANTTSGFSIVKYTGTGSAATVGHGLSTAPKVLINKALSSQDWFVGHSSIGFTKFLKLNTSDVESTNSGIWNNTAPTSSVFTINSANGNTNSTGVEYITYCFSEVKGFSKMGLYQGNSSADGPFIYTGFKPAFFLYKAKGAAQNWTIHDNKRIGYNPVGHLLHPDLANAESNGQSGSLYVSDFCSNGIKIRGSDTNINGSGQGYIYMAFAEHPLVSSTGVPCTAR